MITLFDCAKCLKFVSFLLYATEVKRLKCAMLGAFTVIPFQKSPWNALCRNRILLKIPFYKTKFEDGDDNLNGDANT